MARPSKLTPAQWEEIKRRLSEGEGVRDLAKAFGISPAAISSKGFTKQSERIQNVAKRIVETQAALAELPRHEQYAAVTLADRLRNISHSVASAAELGAKTGHRLHALANSEVGKVDDAVPLSPESIAALKGVGVLTKLANESLSPALNLLSANKDRIKAEDDPDNTLGPELTDVQLARIATAGSR